MLYVAGFANDSIVDGPGIRFTVFFQGCPHHCPGCQNPETWAFEGGTPFTAQDILERIQGNPLAKAVTFSGGEPFAQAQELISLAKLLRHNGYELASYTGYTFEELMAGTPAQKELLGLLDTVVDGRFEQEQLTLELRFRGSRNQRILNVAQSLAAGKAVEETAERWCGSHE